MSGVPSRRHTRRGLACTAVATGRARTLCDTIGQPDPACPCTACQRWAAGTVPQPSTDLARSAS